MKTKYIKIKEDLIPKYAVHLFDPFTLSSCEDPKCVWVDDFFWKEVKKNDYLGHWKKLNDDGFWDKLWEKYQW